MRNSRAADARKSPRDPKKFSATRFSMGDRWLRTSSDDFGRFRTSSDDFGLVRTSSAHCKSRPNPNSSQLSERRRPFPLSHKYAQFVRVALWRRENGMKYEIALDCCGQKLQSSMRAKNPNHLRPNHTESNKLMDSSGSSARSAACAMQQDARCSLQACKLAGCIAASL